MMAKIFFKLFILLLLGAISVNAVAAQPKYAEVRESYIALLGSPQAQRQRHNWIKVIRRIESYLSGAPETSRRDDAEYLLGRTWHGLSHASGSRKDARKAIKIYTEMADDFPSSNLADDALVFAADIALETFSDQTSAYKYYLQITTDLPPGDMLNQAESQLKRLAKVAPVPNQKLQIRQQFGGGRGKLSTVRVWDGAEYTRIVLDLDRAVPFKSQQLKGDDPRIYIDLEAVSIGEKVAQKQKVKTGIVRQIRSHQVENGRSRIVLDLQEEADYQIFSLENPDRVVIDVRKLNKTASIHTPNATPLDDGTDSIANILDDVPGSEPPKLHVPQHNGKAGINLIVVDAGHGGKDPGAVGRKKTREKDITLQMAKRLAEVLRKELKCKVLLTRSDDRYLTLRSRTSYANKVGADLFISLHANASTNRSAYGLETYYLNLSKNNQAAEVAARENGTSLEEVGHLEAILFDLMANAKINESSRLAAEIQQAMVKHLTPKFSRIKNLGVRQGPFHVLLGATMPSVLVETAFISNAREEKRLKTKSYQDRVAQAIVKGVKDYRDTIRQVARK